jgi:hypothetical protein
VVETLEILVLRPNRSALRSRRRVDHAIRERQTEIVADFRGRDGKIGVEIHDLAMLEKSDRIEGSVLALLL